MQKTDCPQFSIANDPATPPERLDALADSADPRLLLALIDNPATRTRTLRRLAATPRIGVRKALLDSARCPLASSVAEDRLAFEGVDLGIFVDEFSRRSVCRAMIGTAHRAETDLLFSDPTFRVLDCLRTLHSLFTIHGGKKRDRKLNRHDYLRFLTDFNARGGDQAVLDLPFITLLTAIRVLGQERMVAVMTACEPPRAKRALRLLEAVIAGQPEEEARQRALLERWIARSEDWPQRLHDYLQRKHRRRVNRHRNRPPRTLYQARLASRVRGYNREHSATGLRLHLPCTERELQALGATMANCVGSEHNLRGAVEGAHVIVLAHPLGKRRKGVTAQFDLRGSLLQARGFANAKGDPALLDFAVAAMQQLIGQANADEDEVEDKGEGEDKVEGEGEVKVE